VNVIQVRKPKEHQMNIVSNSTTKITLLVMNVSFHYELLWCYMNIVTYPKNLAKCYMHGRLDSYVVKGVALMDMWRDWVAVFHWCYCYFFLFFLSSLTL
jgi:hypothetical protein